MKFTFQDKEYAIDGNLASALDSVVHNVQRDQDFVILISGDRMVRVGKSILAMKVCGYLASKLQKVGIKTNYTHSDLYFESEKMLSEALHKGKFAINHYDEGREGLAASKHLLKIQQDLLDFYAECGQLNQIFIICLPDFFDLKEEIAVARSEFLINVYRKAVDRQIDLYGEGKIPIVEFRRGFFEFFNRDKKAFLYDCFRTTRRKNYRACKPNFFGNFANDYLLDEETYKKQKIEALSRFKEKKAQEKQRGNPFRDAKILELHAQGKKASEIVSILEEQFPGNSVSSRWINQIIANSGTGQVGSGSGNSSIIELETEGESA